MDRVPDLVVADKGMDREPAPWDMSVILVTEVTLVTLVGIVAETVPATNPEGQASGVFTATNCATPGSGVWKTSEPFLLVRCCIRRRPDAYDKVAFHCFA